MERAVDNSPPSFPTPCLGASTVTSLTDPGDTTFDPDTFDRDLSPEPEGCEPHPHLDGNPSICPERPPAPSSPLDGLETSLGHSIDLPSPTPAEISRPLCSTFRHGGWIQRRRRTLSCLEGSSASPARLDRFRRCGDKAWVLQSTTEAHRYRLALNRCRDRFCVPCATEHRQVVSRNLREALKGRTLRLMTLTLKSREIPLKDSLGVLEASWRRLRGMMKQQHGLLGGVAFVEISLNPATRLWHPHLHVIFEGQYVPQSWLKQEWLAITGDSFIVDIRQLQDSNQAAGYVAKYASKAISGSVLDDRQRFIEAIDSLTGARMFATFGTWTKLGLSKHPESAAGWQPLRPLYLVIIDARNGCEVSRRILRCLTGVTAHDPLTLFNDDSG